ncbi:MAG: rod-binding protein [Treponema sp.]|jgi:flagellar protein FlgJ|nr:rod-binding protein [Treponema sp.]
MAIEQFGSLYYENAALESLTHRGSALTYSGSVQIDADTGASKGRGFAEVLEKAVTHTEETPDRARGASRKPVVDKTGKLYEQCEALETFLIKNLLNSMRTTVQKTGLIEEGFAGKMYEDMLYDAYAKDFTKQANFGLAELAYLELTGQHT